MSAHNWNAVRLLAIVGFLAAFATGDAFAASVRGTFMGNGKAAELEHVRIIAADPWQEETSYTIILSAEDASASERPEFDAMFGELGHGLVISVTESGEIFGTQVSHQALEKSGFSSTGSTQVEKFAIEAGELRARFFTEGEKEFSGDRWQFDLEVRAPLPTS